MKAISWVTGKIALVSSILVVLCCIALAGPCLLGMKPYTVLSASMEPEIQVASLAYIDTRDKQGQIGKVIAFQMETIEDTTFVVHRIVDETEKGFITKGDNNDAEDMVILRPENIIGTYRYSIPLAGYLFANKTAVLALVFLWIMGFNILSVIFEKISD